MAAKVGELSPAVKPTERQGIGGRGKKTDRTAADQFTVMHKDTLTTYRKLATYQRHGRIDEYWVAVEAEAHAEEISIGRQPNDFHPETLTTYRKLATYQSD